MTFSLVSILTTSSLMLFFIAPASATTGFNVITDDNFERAATSVGSGPNSTSGVGNGWIDFVGDLYNISQPGELNNASINAPGIDLPLNSLYRPQSENYQNGYVRIYNNGTSPTNGGTARFNPANGGSGYAALLYDDTQIYFYKAVDGVQSTLAQGLSLGATAPSNYIFEFDAISIDSNTTQLTASIYDQSAPNTVIASRTITDTTPELQTSGSWGTSCYAYCYSDRVQTAEEIVGGPIVQGTAMADPSTIYKTSAIISATPSTGGYGTISYQWYRDTTNNFTPSNANEINGATTLSYTDTGLTPGTTYYYVVVSTDQKTPTVQTALSNYVQVNTLPTSSPVIGFIGDSITAGVGTTNPPTQAAASIEILQLRTDGYSVAGVNQGAPGSTLQSWVPNGTDYNQALSIFAADNVNTVQIMLGTNDSAVASQVSPATYQTELQTLVTALLNTGYIQKVIINYSPHIGLTLANSVYPGIWDATSNTALLGYETAINNVVNGTNVLLGDTTAYTYFSNNPSEQTDGIHPNVAGHAALGALWAKGFEKAEFQASAASLLTPATTTTASLTGTAATGGIAPYTYQWYRSTTAGFTPGNDSLLAGATSLTLNDTNLTPGTTYYYKLVDSDSSSPANTLTSSAVEVTTVVGLTPGAISATAAPTTTTTALATTAPTGGIAPYTYQWYRSTTAGFTPSSATVIIGATNNVLVDTGLQPGTTYYYAVVYGDASPSGGLLASSDQFAITTSTPPAAAPPAATTTVAKTTSTAIVATSPTDSQSSSPSTTPTTLDITTLDGATYDSTGTPILDSKPTLRGTAPPYSQVTLTFHSTPVVCQTNADAQGNWSCTLDQELAPGSHEVAITATTPEGTVLNFKTIAFRVASPTKELIQSASTTSPKQSNHTPQIVVGTLLVFMALIASVYRLRKPNQSL